MSATQPQTNSAQGEQIAIACVIDSSLALVLEWPRILHDYVSPLLQRLHENYAPRLFRVSVICYAPATTRPTPLLTATFFGHAQAMMIKLRQEGMKFGIGQTGNGAGKGMAVLEGLVAALELFDQLKESEPSVSYTCHIIHLAASPPDSAERPMWNTSPFLDGVTWESLPAEIRKRDLNYSQILVRPIPKLMELHSAVAGTPQPVWFSMRPNQVVRLMGYPPPVQHQSKRPAESTPNQESKRPRIASSQTSPKVMNITPNGATSTPKTQAATTAPSSATTAPHTAPTVTTSSTSTPKLGPQKPQRQQSTPLSPPAQVNAVPRPPSTTEPSAPAPQLQPPLAITSSPTHPPTSTSVAPSVGFPATGGGPAMTPALSGPVSQQQLNMIEERYKLAEQQLTQKAHQLQRMKGSPDYPNLMSVFQKEMQKLTGFGTFVMRVRELFRQQQAKAGQGGQGQGAGAGSSSEAGPSGLSSAQQQQPQPTPPLQAPSLALPQMQPQPQPTTAPFGASLVNAAAASQINVINQAQAQAQVQQPGQGPGQVQMGASMTTAGGVGLPPNVPLQIGVQMQKMIEQQRNRAPGMGGTNLGASMGSGMGSGMGIGNMGSGIAMGGGSMGGMNTMSGVGSGMGSGFMGSMIQREWRGLLGWSGTDTGTNVRLDVRAMVLLKTIDPNADINTASWPRQMHLTPSREQVVPIQLLTDWMKKHQCIAFNMTPLPDPSIDSAENSKALIRLLTEKNIYALATWQNASTGAENRVLFFAIKGAHLVAVFIPSVSGMPELPKPSVGGIPLAGLPVPVAQVLLRLPEAQQRLLAAMAPQQRIETLKKWTVQLKQNQLGQGGQASTSQTHMQATPGGGMAMPQTTPQEMMAAANGMPLQSRVVLPSGPVPMGFAGATPDQQQQRQQAQLQQMQQTMQGGGGMMNFGLQQGMQQMAAARGLGPQGMHQRNPSGGMPGGMAGLPPDVLHSFMQRKPTQDGANGGMR